MRRLYGSRIISMVTIVPSSDLEGGDIYLRYKKYKMRLNMN